MKVTAQAKKLVIPSKKIQHEKSKIAGLAFHLVQEQASKYSGIKGVEFGGSYVKGTWLPERADIDIFIKFTKSVSDKKFTEISKKIGFDAMKKLKPYVRYSEHPYVEATIKGTRVNVVPCYDVKKGQWKSSADRSPFHTQFMLESLTGSMKDSVRLLKSFLKNNRIYGAEIAKQGFSGYVSEVLVWNFGSFEDVIKAIAKVKPGQVIGKASKKFDTPIVIMDPIDSNRNLAAAISSENIGRFVLLAREYLKKPSLKYFKSQDRKLARENLKNTIVVKFSYSKRSPDIIWGQTKRAASALKVQLELGGFRVLRSDAAVDEKSEANLILLLQSHSIPEIHVKEGPEVFSESDSLKFILKNSPKTKLMWVGPNNKIQSLEKRTHNDAKKFVQNLLKKDLEQSGIPKGLKSDIKKGFRVLDAVKIKNKSIKEVISHLVSTDAAIFSSSK